MACYWLSIYISQVLNIRMPQGNPPTCFTCRGAVTSFNLYINFEYEIFEKVN